MRGFAVAAGLSLVLASAPTFAQSAAAPAPRPAPAGGQPTPAAPAPLPFPEGTRYAFVNIQRIASESIEGKAATAKVNALVQKKQAEGAEKTKQLQTAQQKLDTGGSVMSPAALAALQKDIERMTLDVQRFNEDAQQEVQAFQGDLQNEFQVKLSPIIQQVAVEKKLQMLFSVADSGMVWADPSLDITDAIIAKFDSTPAASVAPRAPAAAAQPRPAAPAAPRPAAAPAKP